MKRVEKLELPFYKPGANVNIVLPEKEGDKLTVVYDIPEDTYKAWNCNLIPENYYKLVDSDGTWYIKFKSINENGQIFVDFNIVIWNDKNGQIDGINLEENSWWGDKCDTSFFHCNLCTEKEVEILNFLESKYRKIKKEENLEDWNIEVTDNWTDLIKNN